MINSHNAAKWFIREIPSLAGGHIDENTRINKLLYFANLLCFCHTGDNLFDEDFIGFPNGPVIYSVYRDYRYNGLDQYPQKIDQIEPESLKYLEIIKFIYGDQDALQLVDESHSHNIWKEIEPLIEQKNHANPVIRFDHADQKLKDYYRALYDTYSNTDFSKIGKEVINGHKFFYDKETVEIDDQILSLIMQFPTDETPFVERIDGELVFS